MIHNTKEPTMDADIKDYRTKIKVLGIGGMGITAVNHMLDVHQQMITARMQNVEFIAMCTHAVELDHALATRKILLGEKQCQGCGTGSNPNKGFAAATESRNAIAEAIDGADWVIIVAGMGGGTGSGASPVIASIAAERDILTMGVVTLPFHFEDKIRARTADIWKQQLLRYADSVVAIPN
jgi:cell division protein FtsZ